MDLLDLLCRSSKVVDAKILGQQKNRGASKEANSCNRKNTAKDDGPSHITGLLLLMDQFFFFFLEELGWQASWLACLLSSCTMN